MSGPGASWDSSRVRSDVANSLRPGAPPFGAWQVDELPAEWRTILMHPDTSYGAVELPDTPWGIAYYRWFCSEFDDDAHSVGCTVVNMADYNGGSNQRQQAADCLRSLLQTGKPPAHFVRVLASNVPGVASTEHQVVFGIGEL